MTSLVVKIGGHALDSLRPTSPVLVGLASDIARLQAAGDRKSRHCSLTLVSRDSSTKGFV